jgi:hypothetical protein
MPTDLPLYTLTNTYVNCLYRHALGLNIYDRYSVVALAYANPIICSTIKEWTNLTVCIHCEAEIKIYLFIYL